jgi:hypothetical protein
MKVERRLSSAARDAVGAADQADRLADRLRGAATSRACRAARACSEGVELGQRAQLRRVLQDRVTLLAQMLDDRRLQAAVEEEVALDRAPEKPISAATSSAQP